MATLQKIAITSLVVAVYTAAAWAPLYETPEGIEAISRPSKDLTPSFTSPGLVAKVLVKEGDLVKAGGLLIQLDDLAEKAQLAQLKAKADNDVFIRAAEAQLALKKLELEKVTKAYSEGAATELEFKAAEVAVTIEELSAEKAGFDMAQSELEYQATKAMIDRMNMISPIDGRVEAVAVEEGESVDRAEKIIRVVQIDPLWVDVPVPLARAREHLSEGQVAKVAFTNSDGKIEYANGKIINVGSVADAASDTLKVRVEVPNPSRRPAGEHVRVTFPPAAKADKKVVSKKATSQPNQKAKE